MQKIKKKYYHLKQPHLTDIRREEASHNRGAIEDTEHADVAS
jgi:hypothetical protein